MKHVRMSSLASVCMKFEQASATWTHCCPISLMTACASWSILSLSVSGDYRGFTE